MYAGKGKATVQSFMCTLERENISLPSIMCMNLLEKGNIFMIIVYAGEGKTTFSSFMYWYNYVNERQHFHRLMNSGKLKTAAFSSFM